MDSILLKEKMVDRNCICLMVVCDGVGSTKDGAFAAAMAVRELSEWLDCVTDIDRIGIRLRDAVLEINRLILKQALIQHLNTAATLSALLLADDRFYIVHSGDSRIYSSCGSHLKQLTQDHMSDGKLTSCIGRTERPEIFYNEGSAQGMRFLLCSDGLYKKTESVLIQKELAQVSRKTIKKTVERLARYAMNFGETDNISVAILINEG